jgi:beta-lactamase class A
VLDTLNRPGTPLTAAEVRARFSPTFLAQVPADQLIAVLGQMAAAGPFTLTAFMPADDVSAQARIDGPALALSVSLAVEPTAPNRIVGLLFQPAAAEASPGSSPATSWVEIDTALHGLVSQPSMLAAEITKGSCSPIHALDADRSLAVGSTFKLYVLGELAHQVSAGAAAWDEQLAIRDEWKSLPSGTMQGMPAGTKHTLAEFARQMISISDNTAADHLIHRLGRESVEENLPAMGLANPSRMIPFLTTRELFVLKTPGNADLATAYLAADVPDRRVLLAGEIAAAPVELEFWTAPRQIDTLEWFAGTNDLCAAMVKLRDLGAQPDLDPVLDILAANPGLPVDAARWPYVGFKGGSEPGVLQLTWLLRRLDDRWFVLAMTLDDPADGTDHTIAAVGLAQGALNMLAAVP